MLKRSFRKFSSYRWTRILETSESEEEDISMNDNDEVLLDEQSNSEQSENPAPKYQKDNSQNVSSCSSSNNKPIRRVTCALQSLEPVETMKIT